MGKAIPNFKVVRFTEIKDSQWKIIRKFVDTCRKIKKDLRIIANCLLKFIRTSHNERMLTRNIVHGKVVYGFVPIILEKH